MSIKKNRNDHNGAGSISSTAEGYETNANVIPPPIFINILSIVINYKQNKHFFKKLTPSLYVSTYL